MLIQLGKDLLRLIYPICCEACRESLAETEDRICTRCRLNFRTLPVGGSDPVPPVFAGRVKLQNAKALYFYEKGEPLQKLIHRLKYKSRPEIGLVLGRWLGQALIEAHWVDRVDAIIPMPLTPARRLVRGYNQAERIGFGISEVTGIPIHENWLIRTAADGTQTKKGHFDRWEHVKKSFQVPDAMVTHGKHVLLVDDVITTGSTLEAAAGALIDSGGADVSVSAVGYTAW